MVACPRLRMTRLSPSRTSTVFRSFAVIMRTMRSSRLTSIGPSMDALLAARELFRGFLLNVAALEGFIERGEDFAAAVGDQDVVLDADAALAGEIDARLDGD